MKKAILVLFMFSLINIYSLAAEVTPILLDNSSVYINETQTDETSLINIDDNMKKSAKIKKAKDEASMYRKNKRKIILDANQVNHQRALDYTTRHNSSTMLPTF